MFKLIVLFLLGLILLPNQLLGQDSFKGPLVWSSDEFQIIKKANDHNVIQKYIDKGQTFCDMEPTSVVNKEYTFAPDAHYFCSIGPYWWPDPNGGEKYVNRDGFFNPEINNFDLNRLLDLSNRCYYLSRAFYLTNDKVYYKAFLKQLKVWFVNKGTYMYPTFQYGQVIPGHNNNQGRSTGMIDAYNFNTVIESIRLVESAKRIDRRAYKKIKKWFLNFADDSEMRYGETFRKANNNISLAYDVTMANMYLFAGDEYKAKQIVDAFAELRIKRQIKDDGSQPSEQQRTRAFFDSMYNLTHIIDMCYLARYWYPNYYQEHRDRIDKAFEFLGQYVDNPESFPYQQISDWEECQRNYYNQLNRLKKL